MTADEIRQANLDGVFGIEFSRPLGPMPTDYEPGEDYLAAVDEQLRAEHPYHHGARRHPNCPRCRE